MTTADTAADGRGRAPAAKSPDARDDAVNVSMQDAQSAIESTAAQADRKIEGAHAGMAHSVRQAQTRLKRVRTEARQHIREVNESSVDYIRQNPWSAIGISAGIGLLVGVIFRRR